MKKLLIISAFSILVVGLIVPISKKDHHEEYAEFFNSHKYSTRERLTPEQLKAIPKKDRPDLAMEQDFLLTMDPALGRPAPERLFNVYRQIKAAQKHPVPGTPGSTTTPWVERGPSNVGGRTRAIMFDPNDATHKKVWAGGVTGGLWFNNDITNSTSQWTAVDDFWDNIAITAIAADPTNSNIFYVATGEGWGSSVSGARGAGIWKSTDAGASWNQLTSTSSFYFVNDLVVRDENGTGVVYAGLRGASYAGTIHNTPNEGLQRSTNGGQTFTQVLPNVPGRSFNYAVGDIEIAADNRIWVGTINSANGGSNRGGGTILYSDNGTTWTTSYSNSSGSRVKLATAPSDSAYVYAIIEQSSQVGEIVKTTNHGSTWTNVNEPSDADPNIPASDFSRTQAWVHLALSVDPNDENTVIAGSVDPFRSDDGGNTWDQLAHWYGGFGYTEVHADQQIVVYRPGSSSEALFGNDGGIYRTTNLTATTPSFTSLNRGYNVTQFYSCAIHPTAGTDYFLGGTQDNGSQKFTGPGINSTSEVSGGDGGFCFIDQTNPNIQITSYVYNNFWRSTDGGNSFPSRIQNSSTTGSFINPADYDDNLHILYSARTATSINRILDVDGGYSVGSFQAFLGSQSTHLRVSPYTTTSSTLFVGTGAGRVYKITNAETTSPTVTNITTSSLPAGSISCIDIGSTEDELLVTYSNYGVNSVWYTNDGGTTWTSKEGNLPDMPVRWCLFNPNNRNEAILATEVGVWSSTDLSVSSPSWSPSTSGLANVRTSMLQMRSSDNEVIAGTYGRGIFSSNGFGPEDPPQAAFSASASQACAQDTITFFDQSLNSPTSWQWSFSPSTVTYVNGTSNTSQHPQVVFNASGTYQVDLQVQNTTGNDATQNSIDAEVFTAPKISALGNQLFCSSTEPGLSYQWYLNGNLIPGAGGPIVNITSNGQYMVTVSGNFCYVNSPLFDLQNIGLGEQATISNLKLYPNPVRNNLNLHFDNPQQEDALVQVFATNGQLMVNKQLSASENTLELSHLQKGAYILKLKIGKTEISRSIEKL